jgi:hypothetical protein
MLFKGQQIAVALAAWALIALALLTLFGSLDYTLFFVIAFLGFLVAAAVASPYIVRPRWKSRLDLTAVAGTLIFGLIVAQKALEIWRLPG